MLYAPDGRIRRKDGTFSPRGDGSYRHPPSLRAAVRQLLIEGRTLLEIGRVVGLSGSAVWDIKRALIKAGELPDCPPPITLPPVSILTSRIEATHADYRFAKAWMSP